jgi:hypothetical protein
MYSGIIFIEIGILQKAAMEKQVDNIIYCDPFTLKQKRKISAKLSEFSKEKAIPLKNTL